MSQSVIRWAAFSSEELNQIANALDARLADAEAGNAYVDGPLCAQLLWAIHRVLDEPEEAARYIDRELALIEKESAEPE